MGAENDISETLKGSLDCSTSGQKSRSVVVTGITGGIGSGKSVVSRILRLKGYHVYDCDHHAKVLMDSDRAFKTALCENVDEGVVTEEGDIDRCLLASILFSNPEKMDWVNKTVHAMVRADILRWIKETAIAYFGEIDGSMEGCREADVPLRIFIESAILKKAALDQICDRIWLVTAPEDVRIERVMQRNGLGIPQIKERMQSQQNEYDSLPSGRLDIIENFGTNSLLSQIGYLLG